MARYIFQGTFRDGFGNVVEGGSVYVYLAGTTTAATIYTTDVIVTSTSYVESDSKGYFCFYIDDDDYDYSQNFDIKLTKTGYTEQTYEDIIIFDANGKAREVSFNVTQSSHGFSVGDLLYFNGTNYALGLADAESTSQVIGIVSEEIGTNTFKLLTYGIITGLTGLTAGTVYYLSDSSAGTATSTVPTDSGSYSKQVYVALTTTSAFFTNTASVPVSSSYIKNSLFDANTILKADADDIPEALTIGEQTVVGRLTGGEIKALSVAEIKTLISYTDLMLKTGSNLAIGSDADGDTYYRASSVLARLAKGTADYKMFMNAAGTAPEWAQGIKITTATRAFDAATGNVGYTGAGFKPSGVIVLALVSSSAAMSVGMGAAGINNYSFCDMAGGTPGVYEASTLICKLVEAADKAQSATISSLDSDGATLAWTRSGATGASTITLYFMWLR